MWRSLAGCVIQWRRGPAQGSWHAVPHFAQANPTPMFQPCRPDAAPTPQGPPPLSPPSCPAAGRPSPGGRPARRLGSARRRCRPAALAPPPRRPPQRARPHLPTSRPRPAWACPPPTRARRSCCGGCVPGRRVLWGVCAQQGVLCGPSECGLLRLAKLEALLLHQAAVQCCAVHGKGPRSCVIPGGLGEGGPCTLCPKTHPARVPRAGPRCGRRPATRPRAAAAASPRAARRAAVPPGLAAVCGQQQRRRAGGHGGAAALQRQHAAGRGGRKQRPAAERGGRGRAAALGPLPQQLPALHLAAAHAAGRAGGRGGGRGRAARALGRAARPRQAAAPSAQGAHRLWLAVCMCSSVLYISCRRKPGRKRALLSLPHPPPNTHTPHTPAQTTHTPIWPAQREEDLVRCAAIAADPRLARLRETVLTVDTEAERNTALMLDPYKPRECSMRSPVLLVFQILPTETQPCMRLALLLPCKALLACGRCMHGRLGGRVRAPCCRRCCCWVCLLAVPARQAGAAACRAASAKEQGPPVVLLAPKAFTLAQCCTALQWLQCTPVAHPLHPLSRPIRFTHPLRLPPSPAVVTSVDGEGVVRVSSYTQPGTVNRFHVATGLCAPASA